MDTMLSTTAIMPFMPATAGMDADTDEALLRRFAAGEARAFDVLYERHEMKVWRYVQRSMRNPAVADELMQEVWFSVARQAAQYQPTARFTTWLFTLAHNRMIDFHRATRARFDTAAGGALEPDELPASDQHANPVAQLQSEQQRSAIVRAVAQLPGPQREAFLMHAEGELRVEDIANITRVSYETAKSRLRYARARLRELLQEQA
jgi:RNA polymerase sigma-70 factor (ECF subfamily)